MNPEPHERCMVASTAGSQVRALHGRSAPSARPTTITPAAYVNGAIAPIASQRGPPRAATRAATVPWIGCAAVPAEDFPAPSPAAKKLLRQRPPVAARPVDHHQVRREPHGLAGGANPVVQLPVLRTRKVLVVAAEPVEDLAAEHPEIHGVGRAGRPAEVERGGTDAEWGSHCGGDSTLEVRFPDRLHNPADVRRTRPPDLVDRHADISVRQHPVCVDPDDQIVPSCLDSGVQPVRGSA
jgi:hypothetical protein